MEALRTNSNQTSGSIKRVFSTGGFYTDGFEPNQVRVKGFFTGVVIDDYYEVSCVLGVIWERQEIPPGRVSTLLGPGSVASLLCRLVGRD